MISNILQGLRIIPKTKVDAIAWWIDSGDTTHNQEMQYLMRTVSLQYLDQRTLYQMCKNLKWMNHLMITERDSCSLEEEGKRVRKAKSYGFDFQLYLVKGLRDQVGSQYSYCYSIEEDPRTYNEAMQSRDFAS
ncbi:hypothetical protein Tco_1117926 [Tanacetum coccineum]